MKKIIAGIMGMVLFVTLTGCSDGKSNNAPDNSTEEVSQKQTREVDIDLTVMDSDMIYATIYQILSEPESYEGKTIKAKGLYTSSYYEETGQYYHFIVIEDATACCSQGLEFVWEDGTHGLEEYPEDQAEIIVTGTFETYTEGDDDSLYAHLNHASLQSGQGNT